MIDRFDAQCDLNAAFTKRLFLLVIIRMLGLPRSDEEQLRAQPELIEAVISLRMGGPCRVTR